MPEGPSIVILKDEARGLVGRRIVAVEGRTRIDKERLVGQRIVALRSGASTSWSSCRRSRCARCQRLYPD
ncbi:MAG: hypothetical protein ABIQ33_01075 [Caldimonas sp.]